MGFSYAFLADAQVPVDRADEWLASNAAPEAFEDWPSQWRLDTAPYPLTVGALLQLMGQEQVARVELEDGKLSLRVLADRGMDAWLTYRAPLAAAVRATSRFGGSGRLVVVTFNDAPHDAGFKVEARSNGESSCTDMSADEVASVRSGSDYAELQAVLAAVLSDFADLEDFEDIDE